MTILSATLALGEYSSMPWIGNDTEFDVHYNVMSDNVNDSAAAIEASGLLPARGDPHPDNAYARAKALKCRREAKSPKVWRVVVHYSASPLTQKEEQQALSPLDRPADIDWAQVPYQVPVLFGHGFASNGLIPPTYTPIMVPIVNSAGDLPDPIPEMTAYYWVANVSKNIPITPPSWVMDGYAGSINAAPYQIEELTVEAECSRMTDLRIGTKQKEGTVRYRVLTFTLEFRARRDQRTDASGNPLVVATRVIGNAITSRTEDITDSPPPPFNLELCDIGLHKRNPATGLLERFKTDVAPVQNVAQPIPMDGRGDKLTSPTPYNMVLGNWRILKTKDFSVLPLT